MEPRRVRFGLNPISEVRETRPIPRIPADPSEYASNPERELGIEDNSDDDTAYVVNQDRSRIVQTGEPLDALTINNDGTKFCVGGSRGVLKVFTIYDDNTMEMSGNFRRISTKRLTLLYSPLDVCWSPVLENRIGSTSTNGSVCFWDVEKEALAFHYKEHKRSALTIKFHPKEQDIVISGSKDASVLLYDIRIGEAVQKFASGSFDAVRDLHWSMHEGQEDLFAAADDSGAVRLWDRRRVDKPWSVFHAHHGYVSSVQFAPKAKFMLATGGGRDKYIKIWDITRPAEEGPSYSIETIAPVGKALWRPYGNGSVQIASCSVINDTVVHIWDIRRPFLPYASFHDHKDSVVALAFSPLDETRFVSGGKDGLVIVNDFRWHARYPLNYANDVSLDTAPDGLIGVAVNSLSAEKAPFIEKQAEKSIFSNPQPHKQFGMNSILSNSSSSSSSGRGTAPPSLCESPLLRAPLVRPLRQVTIIDPKDRGKGPVPTRPLPRNRLSGAAELHAAAIAVNSTYDPFRGPTQSLIRCGQPEHASKHLTQRCFVEMALEYRMGGASPPQLAGFNSDVAERHGLHDVARSWRLMTGLVLHELRQTGYPPEWRTDEIERRKGRIEQLALQMKEEGEYMSRTVYTENGKPQPGVRLEIRPQDLVCDFALDRYEPGFRDDVLLRKKRRGRRQVARNADGTPKVPERERFRRDEDTSPEEEEEDPEKRTSRLARWRMRTRLRANDKTNLERVPRTEAPSPVHDPMDDDARYGTFGEYHFGLQPTDVRRKTNEDLAWHGSSRSAHTWRTLPNEAFSVQETMGVRIEEEETKEKKGKRRRSGEMQLEMEMEALSMEESEESSDLSSTPPLHPSDEFSPDEGETAASSVEELLRRHADANDIQTCAVIAIVFGRLMIDLLGEPLVFSWIAAYESMLDRLRLMTAVTEVRKYCVLPAIASKSLAGTFLKLGCLSCRKLVTKGACEKCGKKAVETLCSVCHRQLSGLGWSCRGCGHASHSKHARDWFDRMPCCPVAGCDCECAYWAPPEDTQPLLLRPKSLKQRPPRAPQRALTVETFLLCDQLKAAELQEEFYRRRAWRMRGQLGSTKYVRKLIEEREKKLAKLKRHGVDVETCSYERWKNLSSSSEEEVVECKEGKKIRTRRKKTRKAMPGFRGPLSRRLPIFDVAEEEEEEKEKKRKQELKRIGGIVEKEEEGEKKKKKKRKKKRGKRSTDKKEEKKEKDVPWTCRCGKCEDCRLMRSWRRQLDSIERLLAARRATPHSGARWTRSGRAARAAAAARLRDGYATALQRAMSREWGQRPRWKRPRARRFRPIVREGVHDSDEEKATSDESGATVNRHRLPSNTPSNFKRVRAGLGIGKEPRVPEEYRSNYATFTLESLAQMLEWQAVEWQRQLGVRRILPRAFYRHPLFSLNKEEWLEMPFARLQEHLADVRGLLRRLFGRRRARRVHAQRVRPRGGGWRKRGRGLSGCGYSTKNWGKRSKKGRIAGRIGWCASLLAPRQPRLRYDPARTDYARRLLEDEEILDGGKKRKEHFVSAYSHHIPGWSTMSIKRRIRVVTMRRNAEAIAKRNEESMRVRYDKWKKWEARVYEGRTPRPPRRLFDPTEKAAAEKKQREKEEREAELERMLDEKCLEKDLKSLGGSVSSSFNCRPPRVGEPKPASVKIDVEKEWAKRGGPKRFNLATMFTEDENQRIAKMQVYVDEHARISRENKKIEEKTKRRRERQEKEREFEDAKREYWKRFHEMKKRGEPIPPPPQLDAKESVKEEKARIKREANRATKYWREMHQKLVARSVDHLLDIQMIDTRKYLKKK